ncbi:UDP-N-acetylmuramate--L-alanine ligase [Corynebacterium sp. TAE3-ERU12]|uniref:UDP-N-acetylmuramate--L-alanine ligase n=1 Tax=Corynebacterium sp. TAE3-ERU12 TaxID=2849491 RepID=UPI0021061DB2|nr:UDP-N-acetylmuramate--L-alanine ligase [Corynebacterium sp. TAE3-ERU12]
MIGIGGAGMSGVARILLARGVTVSGSDMKESRAVVGLRAMGAHIAVGHDAANLDLGGEPEAVVVSFAAIPETNPELAEARRRGVEVLKRSDVLGMLMQDYRALLIAGTHGKTSTTSMAVAALQAAGADPSFAVGGLMSKAGVNAHHGTGDVFIAEADESDASLLTYRPQVAIVTNIEEDHLDFFGTADAYYQVFDDFADRVIEGGTLVVCVEDPRAAELGERAVARGIRVLGYGGAEHLAKHPDIPAGAVLGGWSSTGAGAEVTATVLGEDTVVHLQQPGRHMALNAIAALLGGRCVGADLSRMSAGLSDFTGVRRRFDFHGVISEGECAGVRVYDDYAHHPTEVRAVLGAARELVAEAGEGHVIAVFQPHLYSRTAAFADEFAAALDIADSAVVLDVFGAREEPMPGISGATIADKTTVPTVYEPHFTAVPARVREIAGPDDVILTIGAGSVTMLADEILGELQ